MRKYIFLIILGGLLGGLINGSLFVFAYDQINTHPALTDEAVDFYNLNFPENKISDEEKRLLIKGSVDEDTLPRPMNHFYDPVYNQGWLGNNSSKIWAKSSSAQQIDRNLLAINPISLGNRLSDNWPSDFSYERALLDYAKGNRKRAFEAFGHVLHLLEDSNVPDHTRNDTHLPGHATGSPYEKEMAKWNPDNFKIADKLFKQGEKPILLKSLDDYFDYISKYSNGYFFSQDTINSKRYNNPKIREIKKAGFKVQGKELSFAIGTDKYGDEFELALMDIQIVRNFIEIKEATLIHDSIGSSILDGYWDRLSKDFVLHGAGAIKLFLTQAEEFKKEYEKQLAQDRENPKDIFQKLMGAVLPSNADPQNGIAFIQNILPAIESKESKINSVPSPILVFLPTPTPVPLLLLPTIRLTPEPTVTSIPSPVPDVTVSPTTTMTVSPTVTPIPSVTLEGSPATDPIGQTLTVTSNHDTDRVVINEIAWAGTLASSFDEWIELYNSENHDINLTDWVLKSEDSSVGSPQDNPLNIKLSGTIKAGSYFLLERTNDNAIKNITADQIFTGALKNEGMNLVLYNKKGEIDDKIRSSGGWYAGNAENKISMERKDAQNSGDDPSNWKSFEGLSRLAHDANNNPVNGSPRAKNSVVITISGGGNGLSTPTPPSSLSPTPAPSSTLTPSPSPTPSETPSPKVAINEISWMGTPASANDEWIELYNTTSKSLDLSGWTLKSKDGVPSIAIASKSIDPFGFYLLERTTDTTISDVSADQIYVGALSNNGEYLELRDKDGTLQDGVDNSSGWFAGDNATKATMERINPRISGNSSSNWATNNGLTKNGLDAGNNPINGTPKKQNSVYETLKPNAIANLAVSNSSSFGDIILTWTAPEDPDTLISSLSYKIRYATKSFDALTDWDNGKSVASSSLPAVSSNGSMASSSFHIFDYDKDYYFAIRTGDGKNISDLSNSPKYIIKSAQFSTIWPMFGKDNSHVLTSSDQTGPSAKPSKSWEYIDILDSFSQPVIGSVGTIYAGVLRDSGFGYIYAIDSSNGAKKYKFSIGGAKPSLGAVAGDKTSYFGTFDPGGTIYGLNSLGSQSWSYYIGDRVDKLTQGSNGDIYFTSENGKLTALKPNGSVKWQIDNNSLFNHAPIILDNGNLYISSFHGGSPVVWAYRQSDGVQLWQLSLLSMCSCGISDISYDKNSDKFYVSGGGYIAVISSDGSSFEKIAVAPDATTPSLVSFSGDTLYAGFDLITINPASKSAVFAMDKGTKTKKWEYKVGALVNDQMPVDKEGNLYFSTQDGKLRRINKGGALGWEFVQPLIGSVNPISPMLDDGGNIIWGDQDRIMKLK